MMPDARILRRPPNQTVLVVNSGGLVIPTRGTLERRPILLHDNGHTLSIRRSAETWPRSAVHGTTEARGKSHAGASRNIAGLSESRSHGVCSISYV